MAAKMAVGAASIVPKGPILARSGSWHKRCDYYGRNQTVAF